MATRVAKHEHTFRIISHHYDWSKVLIMCKQCPHTEVQTQAKQKVKIETRKYRPISKEEWRDYIATMEHICCDAA